MLTECYGCKKITEEDKFKASLPDFSTFSPEKLIRRMKELEEVIANVPVSRKEKIKAAIEVEKIYKALNDLGGEYAKYTLDYRERNSESIRDVSLANKVVLLNSMSRTLV